MYTNVRVVKGVVRTLKTPMGKYIVELIRLSNSQYFIGPASLKSKTKVLPGNENYPVHQK